jgi:predicted DNA-binding transcriptional regulator YafY
VTTPAGRLLQLLELLQARPVTTGREIAERLDIDPRTVRRYIAALLELGIPVDGARGVGGGYRLRPGYRLAPLMLSDAEAVATAVGLLVADRQGIGSADAALAKVHRVLPDRLRRQVQALETVLGLTTPSVSGAPVAGSDALMLADAIHRRQRVHARHRSVEGARTDRELSPHGLVVHAGRWYLIAHDHGRNDLRTFRVDRLTGVTVAPAAALAQPDGFDPVAEVSRSLALVPWPWRVEVILDLSVEQAAERLPGTLAGLHDEQGRTRLTMRVSSLDWAAAILSGLQCEFTVVQPDELRASIRDLAERLNRAGAVVNRS